MKAFANVNPRDLRDAVATLQKTRRDGRHASIAGGGTDLLGLIKERLVRPDVVVNLKSMTEASLVGVTRGSERPRGVRIGGLTTLAAVARDPLIVAEYPVLAEAAASVATPQIRNAATIAGNVCQRPWCWYLRNNFPCLKNGGDRCFAPTGEHQFHAIFGGGPSFIVHPSDTAPALVALDARFRLVGPSGARTILAKDFFALPSVTPSKENVLRDDEILAEILLPERPAIAQGASKLTRRATYRKLLDREAWTHAVISAAITLDMDGDICRRARIVLGGVAPIPWDLPAVAALLKDQRLTPELAARAGDVAVEGATPLPKNAYKVPLTRALVRRTLFDLAARA
jgi:xanthine dehydrogenase YagS FAD-binding subunit